MRRSLLAVVQPSLARMPLASRASLARMQARLPFREAARLGWKKTLNAWLSCCSGFEGQGVSNVVWIDSEALASQICWAWRANFLSKKNVARSPFQPHVALRLHRAWVALWGFLHHGDPTQRSPFPVMEKEMSLKLCGKNCFLPKQNHLIRINTDLQGSKHKVLGFLPLHSHICIYI